MGELGYGTRGPLVSKLKQLLSDVQSVYETFLDANTLYQQGKISDKEFFAKAGDFLKQFSSLGFLTVKVILELDSAIGREDSSKKPTAVTTPSPTYTPDFGQVSTPMYTQAKAESGIDSKSCVQCGARLPKVAKFCTSCGKPQSS